jgi:hypothetical protein
VDAGKSAGRAQGVQVPDAWFLLRARWIARLAERCAAAEPCTRGAVLFAEQSSAAQAAAADRSRWAALGVAESPEPAARAMPSPGALQTREVQRQLPEAGLRDAAELRQAARRLELEEQLAAQLRPAVPQRAAEARALSLAE